MKKILFTIPLLALLISSPAFASTVATVTIASGLTNRYHVDNLSLSGTTAYFNSADFSPGNVIKFIGGSGYSPQTYTSLGGDWYSISFVGENPRSNNLNFDVLTGGGDFVLISTPLVFQDNAPVLACSPDTISHGTIGAFPGCTASCDSGYYISAPNTCTIATSTPSGSSGSGMFAIPTSTGSRITATISNSISNAGLLAIIVIATAIPLSFIVGKGLVGLVARRKKNR